MTAKEILKLLAKTIPAKMPILLKGAPGVGKTDIITQAAKAAKADLLVMHPVVSDPTDFKGMPAVVNGTADFLPFGDLRALTTAKRLTVAFLDDLGQAPAVVQAAAMQLILARRVNGHKVSDNVVFVAATNRREDRAGVTGILEPVKSRFMSIVEMQPSADELAVWLLDNDFSAVVPAFVRFRQDLILDTNPTNDIVNRACPRTIAHLGRLFDAGIEDFEALAGAAGQAYATEFLAFVKIWRDLPDIDEILINPKGAAVPVEKSALYAIATALASKVSASNAERAMTYIARLPIEFAVLCVRDSMQRCKDIAKNKEFIAWAAKHQDVMV